jgi:hypothetical protein
MTKDGFAKDSELFLLLLTCSNQVFEVLGLNSWGGNSSFETCYGRTKTALVGLLRLVLIRFAGSKTRGRI